MTYARQSPPRCLASWAAALVGLALLAPAAARADGEPGPPGSEPPPRHHRHHAKHHTTHEHASAKHHHTKLAERTTEPAAAPVGDNAGPDDESAPLHELDPARAHDLTILAAEPVHGGESSGFGWRDDPIKHRAKFHAGTDYRAPRGTPVHTAADGVVVRAGRMGGYGRSIDVAHAGGVLTRYGHLNKILVDKGAHVHADDVIGQVGSTGRATGPHLHFEVRLDGKVVNPRVAECVGRIQREFPVDAAPLAAAALDPERARHVISLTDPPGSRHHRHKKRHPPRVT